MNQIDKSKKHLNEIGFYTDLGLRYAIIIIVFLFLGYWIGGKTGLRPIFTIIFVFLGAFVGFYNFYKSLVYHMEKNGKKEL
jgi:F0F1-type ATP synthase assembly protein I